MGVSIWDAVHSTWWTGGRWVEQMSRLHRTAFWRQCGSTAMKLSMLDACEDKKVVCWFRTQVSSHSSQGVVDDKVNEAGVGKCGTRQERSTLLLNGPGLMWLFAMLLHQLPARASKPPQACNDAIVKFLQSDLRSWWYVSVLSNITPRYVGSDQKSRVSLLCLTFISRLTSLLLRWKTANTAFVVPCFNFQVWRYSPTVAMSVLNTFSLFVSLHQHVQYDC